jgi:hypothetical protein
MGFCDEGDRQQQWGWHSFNLAAGGKALPAFEFSGEFQ